MQSHYEVLGISENATPEEIRAAYKKAFIKDHPDRNPNNVNAATEKAKVIAEAYGILSNPEKRKIYDQKLSGKQQDSQNSQGSATASSAPTFTLFQAVQSQNVDAAKLATSKASYFELAARMNLLIDQQFLPLNPLENAIARGYLPLVKAITSSLKFYLLALNENEVPKGRGNQIFKIAAKFYDKNIFLHLLDMLREQRKRPTLNHNEKPYLFSELRIDLSKALEQVLTIPLTELSSQEPIDILLEQGACPTQNSLQSLFSNTSKVFLKNFIAKYGAAGFVKEAIRQCDQIMLTELKSLGFSVDLEGVNPYEVLASTPMTYTQKNAKTVESVIADLVAKSCKLSYENMLRAAGENNLALLKFLEGNLLGSYPSITSQQYVKILFTFLKKLSHFTELEKKICACLANKLEDIYEQCDELGNNCLHEAAARRNTATDPTTYFFKFLEENFRKKYPLEIANQKIAKLIAMKNKDGLLPEQMTPHNKIPNQFKQWKKLDPHNTQSVAKNARPSLPRHPLPDSNFFQKPPAVVSFETLMKHSELNNLVEFKQVIASLTLEALLAPDFGYCLLIKSILLSKVEMISLLLSAGCKVFLKNDNPYASPLFKVTTNEEINKLIIATAKEVNSMGVKRPHEANCVEEPKSPKVAKLSEEEDIEVLLSDNDELQFPEDTATNGRFTL